MLDRCAKSLVDQNEIGRRGHDFLQRVFGIDDEPAPVEGIMRAFDRLDIHAPAEFPLCDAYKHGASPVGSRRQEGTIRLRGILGRL